MLHFKTDAEIERITGGLEVLAVTSTLREGDFAGFRRIASSFLSQYGDGAVLLVADRDGHQLFSSSTTDTASLPTRNNLEIVKKVFTTRAPQYSNLFVGSTAKRAIITVEVPVVRGEEVVYEISFSPPIELFQAIVVVPEITDALRPLDGTLSPSAMATMCSIPIATEVRASPIVSGAPVARITASGRPGRSAREE